MTGRAVVMVGRRFELREHPVPDPAPGTLLLRQELAGICGTDVHNWEHQRLTGEILLGHENVGIIARLGEGVTADALGRPLKEGDRVIFPPGTPNGAYGFLAEGSGPPFRGGFADYIYLHLPQTYVLKTLLPPEVAVLAEPFAVGVHGVMRSGLRLGDTVVVQGSGAIGLLTLLCARASGAGRLIMVGGPSGRLALARRLGADVTVDIGEVPDTAERVRLVRESTPKGAGADVVFECAGFLPAIPEGIGCVRQGGVYVEMGHFVDVGSIELNPNQMLLRKNLRLEAIFGYGGNEIFTRGVTLLERNEFPFAELVDPILPLERAADGFAALTGGYRLDGRDVVKIALRGAA
jgi:threonine dehydrogenase-like Zn-dependent dehydrogenase